MSGFITEQRPAAAEFKLDVPGNYILVDHALSRAERGLVSILRVEGRGAAKQYA